jgi:hypothetical protein
MVERQRREPGPAAAPIGKEGELVLGLGEISLKSSARRLEFSDILTIARFPAATAPVSGPKLRKIG